MKIGFLLPRSVLYPSLSFDIVDGLTACLKKTGIEKEYDIITESIGIAGKNEEIYTKCEKLLLQGADIVIGYMNPASAEFIHPLLESAGKSLLVLDSGYHFPTWKVKLSNAWFITLQGNLQSRAIVRKAIQDDGNTSFAFTCSLYDAGYRPAYTFSAAAAEKSASIVFNHVTPLNRADFSLDPLADFLENNGDTAIFASFCGDMIEDFFREVSKSNSISKTAIYGSGFTAEEVWLDKIPYPGFDWNCATAWSKEINTPENDEFTETLEGIKKGKANLFSLLGWEAAQFIEAAAGGSFDDIVISSPRGQVYMDAEDRFSQAPIYYATVANNTQSGNCELKDVINVVDLESERKRLRNDITLLQNVTTNSWLNAYACLDS